MKILGILSNSKNFVSNREKLLLSKSSRELEKGLDVSGFGSLKTNQHQRESLNLLEPVYLNV